MSRFAVLLFGGILTIGLAGCDVDVDDREPDVIDSDPGTASPGVDIEVDDKPDVVTPGVDVDVDANRPRTTAPDVDVNVSPDNEP